MNGTLMYHVESVKSLAQSALLKKNDPEDSRQIYLENIMDWTDSYVENLKSNEESSEAKEALRSIGNLWIEYATMEAGLHQYKKAVQVFENALSDDLVQNCPSVYLAYADYCKNRGKSASAQKVFVKAILKNFSERYNDLIWKQFLLMMRADNSPQLTIEELYMAVKQEAKFGKAIFPSPSFLDAIVDSATESGSTFEAERSLLTNTENIGSNAYTALESHLTGSNSTSLKAIPISGSKVTKELGEPERVQFTPELLCRIYKQRPPMLFTSPDKDPMLTAFSSLLDEEISAVASFLSAATSSTLPYPPSAQSSNINSEAAATPAEDHGRAALLALARAFVKSPQGDLYLDLLEGLWSAQALKERHFDSYFADVQGIFFNEEQNLLRSFEEREGTCPPNDKNLISQVRSKNQAELKRFQDHVLVRREVLYAAVNETLFTLLLEQERALTKLQLPYFSADILRRLEAHVNLFTASKATAPVSSVVNVETSSSFFENDLTEIVKRQQRVVCALLALRLRSDALTTSTAGATSKPSAFHTSASSITPGGAVLSRASSVSSDGTSLSGSTQTDDISDYYSLEAKTRRKKRRMSQSASMSPTVVQETGGVGTITSSSNSNTVFNSDVTSAASAPSFVDIDHFLHSAIAPRSLDSSKSHLDPRSSQSFSLQEQHVHQQGGERRGGVVGKDKLSPLSKSAPSALMQYVPPQGAAATSSTGSGYVAEQAQPQEQTALPLLQKLATILQKVKK